MTVTGPSFALTGKADGESDGVEAPNVQQVSVSVKMNLPGKETTIDLLYEYTVQEGVLFCYVVL